MAMARAGRMRIEWWDLMENLLRKQLAQIRKRALLLRYKAERREELTREAGREIVEEIVETGAVVRGADFDKLRTVRRRWPWSRHGVGSGADASRAVIERFKTGEPRPLEELVPGEDRSVEGAGFYLVRPVGSAVDPTAREEAQSFSRMQSWPNEVRVSPVGASDTPGKTSRGAASRDFDPRRVVYLDIETGGLSANTYMFLCGLMFLDDGDFIVEQAFARNYAEEEGCLRHVRATMARFDAVATYNGASFDLPFIRTRMAIHRIPDVDPIGSVDLLHTARRVFRGILPDRRLLTVERHLRGFSRSDDIPGRYIPEAWHDYVRTGDGRVMQNVLYHNRMDLFAMAVLVNRLATKTGAGL